MGGKEKMNWLISGGILIAFFITLEAVALSVNKPRREETRFLATYCWRLAIACLLADICSKL